MVYVWWKRVLGGRCCFWNKNEMTCNESKWKYRTENPKNVSWVAWCWYVLFNSRTKVELFYGSTALHWTNGLITVDFNIISSVAVTSFLMLQIWKPFLSTNLQSSDKTWGSWVIWCKLYVLFPLRYTCIKIFRLKADDKKILCYNHRF